MSKKYKLLKNDTVKIDGKIFYRIQALRDGRFFNKGDKGGYVESESNLSQEGDAWVSGNARVSGNAWVFGNARVFGDAWVFDNAKVSGDAWVSGNAWVFGNARVSGDAWVSYNAKVSGDAWVSGNARVSGNATVSGDAWVSYNAKVSGDAWVSGNARVSGNATVFGNARVSGDAKVFGDDDIIFGKIGKYPFTATFQYLQIGCQNHTWAKWGEFNKKWWEEVASDGLKFYKTYWPLLKPMEKTFKKPAEVKADE